MYTFEEIKANQLIIKNLQNAIRSKKIHHSYIFDGQVGMGKNLFARTFAKTLQCEKEGITPCNACISCKSFDNLNHPDIIYVKSEKSSIGVEEVREKINKIIEIKPYKYQYKIIIVDNADTMTHSAQNAILKTIEEPPRYGVFLFLSTNINSFLPTILSRCVSFKLKPLSNPEVREYLKDTNSVSDDMLDFYVAYAQGNIGYAKKLVKEEGFFAMRDTMIELISNLDKKDMEGVFSQFKIIEEFKGNIQDAIDIMYLYLRDAIVAKEIGTEHILQKDKESNILQYIKSLTLQNLFDRLDAVCDARESLRQNGNFQMTMEVMMLKLRKRNN